jgi:hypothetical protein
LELSSRTALGRKIVIVLIVIVILGAAGALVLSRSSSDSSITAASTSSASKGTSSSLSSSIDQTQTTSQGSTSTGSSSSTSTGSGGPTSIMLSNPGALSPSGILPNFETGDFGWSTAISGTTVVVGAPEDSEGGLPETGRVYLFNSTDGALLQILSSPDPQVSGEFGWSVALGSGILSVGDPEGDVTTPTTTTTLIPGDAFIFKIE